MIIDARALAKTFRRRDAVRNLTLQVPEGSALALIGPNGAGKTTSLRLLANILSPRPRRRVRPGRRLASPVRG